MAVTDAMVDFALGVRPGDACFVPERREELTTEGGLDVAGHAARVTAAARRLAAAGVRVSLFIDPDPAQVRASRHAGVHAVELHTGEYANAAGDAERGRQLARLRRAAAEAALLGLEVHAGHGLTVANVRPVAAIAEIVELNIGHAIVARAVLVGGAAGSHGRGRASTRASGQGSTRRSPAPRRRRSRPSPPPARPSWPSTSRRACRPTRGRRSARPCAPP